MNEYESIKKYICNEPRMKPFLKQAKDECIKSNCQSWASILNLAIENLLDAYEDKCDDIKYLENNEMKIFTIEAEEQEYDCVDSVAVLAKNKENAIKLALDYDNIFKNNIGEIKEVSTKKECVIMESVLEG